MIGIIARNGDDKPPFGRQTYFFEDMPLDTPGMPGVFFFDPQDWHKGKNTTKGYIYHTGKKLWEEKELEVPLYIYERYSVETPQEDQHLQAFRAYIRARNGNLYNSEPLKKFVKDKYQVFEFLTKHCLPTINTIRLHDSRLFVDFLDKHPQNIFYIKINNGSRGKNIYILHKKETYFEIALAGETKKFAQANKVYQHLSNHLPDYQNYIVQPRADADRINGGSFDVRALVQNYGNAQYHVGGMGVRVGAKDGYLSNLSQGARAMSYADMVTYYQATRQQDITGLDNKMREVCLQAAEVLHRTYGDFLELGFDLLVTKNLEVQILEINALPSRWIFTMIADVSEDNPSQKQEFIRLRKETTGKFLWFFKEKFFT